jgi:hypothetical protein
MCLVVAAWGSGDSVSLSWRLRQPTSLLVSSKRPFAAALVNGFENGRATASGFENGVVVAECHCFTQGWT